MRGNIFSFQFRDKYDRDRVLSEGPWSFDNTLIAMEKPEGKGGMIGEVLEVDGGASGDYVGKFMRVRVRIDISGSLKRCLRVAILGDRAVTMMFQFPLLMAKKCFLLEFGYELQMKSESNWRKDKEKEKEKSGMEDRASSGLEEDRWVDSTSNAGPIIATKQDHVAAELMGSVSERVSVVSIHIDNVMVQQVEEVGGLVDIETDREFINDNELVVEGIDNSDSRESARVGINDEKQVGEASEVVFGDRGKSVKIQQITEGSQAYPNWTEFEAQEASLKVSDIISSATDIGPGKSFNKVKPFSRLLESNSSLERPSASFRPSVRIRDNIKIRRGSSVARIRKLGIYTDSSKQFCGKRKSYSEKGGPDFDERKTRKLDGLSTMEDEFNKSMSERGSSGVVTGFMGSMGNEDIATLCAQMNLLEREGPIRRLQDNLKVAGAQRLSLCLAGKVMMSKPVNIGAFMGVIVRIWRVEDGVEVENVSPNVFTFQFQSAEDHRSVTDGGPWTFDSALIVLEEPTGMGAIGNLSFRLTDFWVQVHNVPLICLTKEIGHFLGSLIGSVLEIDIGAVVEGLGKFLRIRVRIDATQPLRRCLRVDVMGDGLETVMGLRYERLPKHCFRCGRFGHPTNECLDPIGTIGDDGNEVLLYGAWLRGLVPDNRLGQRGRWGGAGRYRERMGVGGKNKDSSARAPWYSATAVDSGGRRSLDPSSGCVAGYDCSTAYLRSGCDFGSDGCDCGNNIEGGGVEARVGRHIGFVFKFQNTDVALHAEISKVSGPALKGSSIQRPTSKGKEKVAIGFVIGPSLPQSCGLTPLLDPSKLVNVGVVGLDSAPVMNVDGSGERVTLDPEDNMKIKDMMKGRGKRDFVNCDNQDLFLEDDVSAIKSIPCSSALRDDSLCWHHTKDGNYTVNSRYFLGCLKESAASSSGERGTGFSWRNNYTHDGGRIEVGSVVEWCKKYVVDLNDATGAVVVRGNVQLTEPVRWASPMVGMYKLNTDVAIDGLRPSIGVGLVKWTRYTLCGMLKRAGHI
ncbi:hypothetical protein EZV62_007298 [Acer yangbiense]|uniref:CCHC-type domain-containing protein n=1 Tax=Acer yangbiense TaxID=1000413 RepID=A0A5C7I8V5_9ROSI|nr:hypothetical protein EZV62_007298 [Acer yangbiense]